MTHLLNRRSLALIGIGILLIGVAVVGLPRLWPPANGSRKVVVAQAGDFFLYAPLYLALDAGFFRDRKLDVSLVSTGGDEKTWAAVVGGSAQFGVADPTFVVIADSRGRPGRVIASIVNGVPFWGITYDRAIPPVTRPDQLAPYSVATFPSPSTAFALQSEMFKRGGLRPNIREGAFGTLIALLKSGQAQIALELEPNVSQAVEDGARVLYAMPSFYGDFAITGLTASPDLLTNKRDIVADVICALQMALDYAHKKPEAALTLLSKRFPEINQDVAKAAFVRVINAGIIPSTVSTTAAAWDRAVALRVNVGDVRNPKAMAAYVDNTFAETAAQQCRLQ